MHTRLYSAVASLLLAIMLVFPVSITPALAASGNFSIESLFTRVGSSLNLIILWLFLLATVLLLAAALQYITAGGDEEKLKSARSLLLYGVLGLAVMVTVWAFVTVVIDFFFQSGTPISIPGGTIVDPL